MYIHGDQYVQTERGAPLVEVVPRVLHDGLQPQPGLLCGGNDLAGWQEEAVVPSIS